MAAKKAGGCPHLCQKCPQMRRGKDEDIFGENEDIVFVEAALHLTKIL
jgi:hypothetical protein